MSKKEIIDAAGFTVILAGATDKTDYPALIKQVIDALGASEQVIVVLQANAVEAGNKIKELNATVEELKAAGELSASMVTGLDETIEGLNEGILGHEQEYAALKELYDAALTTGQSTAASELQEQLDEALKEIADLGKKLEMREKTRDQEGILVEIGDVSKLLIGKNFTIKAKRYTADEVSKDPDLLDHLYKTNSHSLVDPVVDVN